MVLYVHHELNPNVSRDHTQRLLSTSFFLNLLDYIKQNNPSLREITNHFTEKNRKEIIDAIETGIANNWINRENKRYFSTIPIIAKEDFINYQDKYKDIISLLNNKIIQLSEDYQLTVDQINNLIYGYYLGYIIPKNLQPLTIYDIDQNLLNFKYYDAYHIKNYLISDFQTFNHSYINWLDYFKTINNQKDQIPTYKQIRSFLGDVHPDYFLDNTLRLYKKINRRKNIKYTDSDIYLNANIMMNQINNNDDLCTLNINIYNKLDMNQLIEIYHELNNYIYNELKITFADWTEYIFFYNSLINCNSNLDSIKQSEIFSYNVELNII